MKANLLESIVGLALSEEKLPLGQPSQAGSFALHHAELGWKREVNGLGLGLRSIISSGLGGPEPVFGVLFIALIYQVSIMLSLGKLAHICV